QRRRGRRNGVEGEVTAFRCEMHHLGDEPTLERADVDAARPRRQERGEDGLQVPVVPRVSRPESLLERVPALDAPNLQSDLAKRLLDAACHQWVCCHGATVDDRIPVKTESGVESIVDGTSATLGALRGVVP